MLDKKYWAGEQIPPGNLAIEATDIPNGRSYNIVGSGGGPSGDSPLNGTQLVPASTLQPYLVRIGEGGTNIGLGSGIRDLSFIGRRGYQGDGLVMTSFGGARIRDVGFGHLKRGLLVRPGHLKRAVGLHVDGGWYAHCEEAIVVDLSLTNTIATLRLAPRYITTGCKVGINLVEPFRYRTQVPDVYCEGQTVAGFVQHTGDVIYKRCYLEHGNNDEDGDRNIEPVPSVALLGNAVGRFRDMEKITWLYVGRDAKFFVDEYSRDRITYVIFEAGDPRINEWRTPAPGKLVRAHIAHEPWTIERPIEVERVRP